MIESREFSCICRLASGSVKEAPLCNPYRKLYFDHLNTVKQRAENKAKKDKAEKGQKEFATSKEGHKVGQNKITNLFICSNIKCAAHGNTAWQNNDSKVRAFLIFITYEYTEGD